MNIVNVSTAAPEWTWLACRFADRPDLRWTHVSTEAMPVRRWLPHGDLARRVLAARAPCRLASPDDSMPVSHWPRISLYVELANRRRPRRAHPLAHVFNYTELPHGKKRALHAHALATVDRFVVFSITEREIYARCFDLSIKRIDMIHWAVRQPAISADKPALVAGDYLCAVGGEGRGYGFSSRRRASSRRCVWSSSRPAPRWPASPRPATSRFASTRRSPKRRTSSPKAASWRCRWTTRTGENGRAFTREHCMDDNAVAYFRAYPAGRCEAAASG